MTYEINEHWEDHTRDGMHNPIPEDDYDEVNNRLRRDDLKRYLRLFNLHIFQNIERYSQKRSRPLS